MSVTGWFLGAALSGLALPGVALAGTFPAIAPAVSTNGDPSAAGAPPTPTAAPSPSTGAPATPGAGAAAPPLSPPPPPYAPAPYPAPYPAPPPGYYAYPPAGYPPPSYGAAERLAVLEAQIRDLQARREDISLVTPLVLLIGGGGLGAVGLVAIGANSCSTDQYGNQLDPTCRENQSGIDRGVGLLVVGGLGVVFGGTSLIIRSARRRHIARQIEQRQIEANALRPLAPRWGVRPVGTGGGMISLALDF